MENPEEEFEIIISRPAEISFYEILEYFYEHYSLERAERISNELRDFVKKLKYFPERGNIEKRLLNRSKEYKFILFKRSARADIKIIYNIHKENSKVFIIDFFPTESDEYTISKMG